VVCGIGLVRLIIAGKVVGAGCPGGLGRGRPVMGGAEGREQGRGSMGVESNGDQGYGFAEESSSGEGDWWTSWQYGLARHGVVGEVSSLSRGRVVRGEGSEQGEGRDGKGN